MRRALVLALVAFIGCDQVEPIDETTRSSVPSSVQDAFSRSCATANCHDTATHSAGLDLSPAGADAVFDVVVKDRPAVRIGDPAGSTMALALLQEPPVGITRMPAVRTEESLTDAALVLAWIAGAEMPDMDEAGEESSGG